MPPALDVTTAAPFVGRSEELAAVDHAWQTVRGGARRLVVVSGEAGIGVSRFLAEAAGGAASDGRRRILDIVPTALHERIPLVIGGAADVEYVNMVVAEAEGIA